MKIGLILALLLLPFVSAVSDTKPPTLVSFDFEPKVVDASKSDQIIIFFTAQIIDDLSGFSDAAGFNFNSPSGKQNLLVNFHEGNLVSGDFRNGTYTTSETLPQSRIFLHKG